MKKGSSELVLLDVNVLIALAWPNHQFHASAIRRLERSGQRWATCALTQLGFIRLSSNPAVVHDTVRPGQAAELLAHLVSDRLHTYLPLSPPPGQTVSVFRDLLGYRQVTDAYLTAVAQKSGARLLTFDTRMLDFGNVEVLV